MTCFQAGVEAYLERRNRTMAGMKPWCRDEGRRALGHLEAYGV